MKNIEKYTNTKDALDAYNILDFKKVPFDIWLECEYEDPHLPTLLEAAEALVREWYRCDIDRCSFERFIDRLSHAVECEKRRPIRNFDKYKTAEDAFYGFKEMCFPNGVNECKDCRFNNVKEFGICAFAYLYAEAEKAR